MPDRDAGTYERRVLYKQVWAEPMEKVAARLDISDVYLARVICRRLGVRDQRAKVDAPFGDTDGVQAGNAGDIQQHINPGALSAFQL